MVTIIKPKKNKTSNGGNFKLISALLGSFGGFFAIIPILVMIAVFPSSLNSSIYESKNPDIEQVYNNLTPQLELTRAQNETEWNLLWDGVGAFFRGEYDAFKSAKDYADALDSLFFAFDENVEKADEYYQGSNMTMNTLAMIFKASYINALKNAQVQVAETNADNVIVANESKLGRNGQSYVDNREAGSPKLIIDTSNPLFKTHEHLPGDYRLRNITFKEPEIIVTQPDPTSYLMPAIYMVAYQSSFDALDATSDSPDPYDIDDVNKSITKKVFDRAQEIAKHDNPTIRTSGTRYSQITDAFIASSEYDVEVTSTPEDIYHEDVYNGPEVSSYSEALCAHNCYIETITRTIYIEDEFGNLTPDTKTTYKTHHYHRIYDYTAVDYTATMKVRYSVELNPELEKNIRENYGLLEEQCDNIEVNIETLLQIYRTSLGWIDLGMIFVSPISSSNMEYVACSAPFGHLDGGVHSSGHDGFDIARRYADISVHSMPLLAICDARIDRIREDSDGFGHYYVLTPVDANGNELLYEGQTIEIFYGHCEKINPELPGVAEGALVSAGQEIARLGNTGNSTGPHLHLEIRLIGPEGRTVVDPAANVPGLLNMPAQNF